MNIVADVHNCIAEYQTMMGHRPKRILLGEKEKQRVKELPELMLCKKYETFPDAILGIKIQWVELETIIAAVN